MCGDLFFGRESCSEFSPSSRAAEFAAHTRRYEDNKVKCIINGFAGVGVGTLSGSKGIVRTCRETRERVFFKVPQKSQPAREALFDVGGGFSHTRPRLHPRHRKGMPGIHLRSLLGNRELTSPSVTPLFCQRSQRWHRVWFGERQRCALTQGEKAHFLPLNGRNNQIYI